MRLRARIKEAVHYCSFPSSQSEVHFFTSQSQFFLAVWQNLDALFPTKRWMLLRLEAHHDNWKVFVVTHEPENRPVRNYSAALSLNMRAWDDLCSHGWISCLWTDCQHPNQLLEMVLEHSQAQNKARVLLGVAGSFGPESHLKTILKHHCPSAKICAIAPLSYKYGCNLCALLY